MSECALPMKIEFVHPDEKTANLITSLYAVKTNKKYVFAGPKKYVVPASYIAEREKFINFEIRPDDVWLFGYPRTGTTLTQETLWLIGHDLDFESAAKEVLDLRFPFVDQGLLRDEDEKEDFKKSDANEQNNLVDNLFVPPHIKLNSAPSPRFIKSHLPMSLFNPKLLESGCKVVYIARNPRDVAVSNYHIIKLFKQFEEGVTFKQYWELFHKNLGFYLPYIEHVKEGWEKRNHKNVLFLFYEEINKDKAATIKRICDFMGKKLSDDDMSKLLNHLDIKNFKDNKSVNNDHLIKIGMFTDGKDNNTFIRKGKVGGWRDHFDEEMMAQADKWIADALKDTDLRFPDS